jgi:hypothetical protein
MAQLTAHQTTREVVSSDLMDLVQQIVENGIVAGILGAVVVAVWFFFLDLVTRGLPFYTPSLLGSIAFAGMEANEVTAINWAAVFAYTGLHGLLFLVAGVLLAWIFAQAERNPQVGMILLLLFVTVEAILWGVGVSTIPALAGAVGAWAVLVANVASALAMFGFLLRRHPHALEHLRHVLDE